MQGSDYYRRQADICLALSLMGEDPMIAVALIAMARELLEKAEEAERGAEVPPPHVTDRDPSDDGDARRDESPQ